ncbi:MAG: IclR family transcriptional regulator [Desulfuromonas sp.]|nr:MAG: IclR family transcriptional regulator [Desulfuromonas sp.]
MAQDRVEAVERALDILNSFSEEQPLLSLKQLAEHTGFYKSTILRLAASLERYGYLVRQQDGRYRLGLALINLGDISRRNFDIGSIVRPVLDGLRDRFNESVAFYVKSGDKRLCLYRANANRAIRHQLHEGHRLPLDKGAAGRVILAFTGQSGEPYETIRRQQWYASHGERDPEVASVCVPLLTSDGELMATLSISGLISRFDEARQSEYITELQKCAAELAEQLDPQPLLELAH